MLVPPWRRASVPSKSQKITLADEPLTSSGAARVASVVILTTVDDVVVFELVGSEMEAEILCGRLRSSGVKCGHRATNLAAGRADGMPGGGPREVLVDSEDVSRARDVLEHRGRNRS